MDRRLILRAARTWLALLAAALPGCGSAPAVAADEPSGEPVVVRLRSDGFVDFEGARVAFEEMVFDLRRRCRAAAAAHEPPPWLVVVAPPGVVDLPAVVDRLRAAAYDAGVQHIELSAEGA